MRSLRIRTWSGVMLALAEIGRSAGASNLPSGPDIATEATCHEYSQKLYSRQSDLFAAETQCMQKPSEKLRAAKDCNSGTGQIRVYVRAWPQCDKYEDEQCEIYNLQSTNVKDCYRRARVKENEFTQAKRLEDAATKDFESLKSKMENYKNAYVDPSQFFRNLLETTMDSKLRNSLPSLQDSQGRFTSKGLTDLQETYDYIFGKLMGADRFRSANPIISAIQGAAAEQIKRAHSETIREIEELIAHYRSLSIDRSTISPASRTTEYKKPVPSTDRFEPTAETNLPSVSGDCAILTSEGRTDLIMNNPDYFQYLVETCISK